MSSIHRPAGESLSFPAQNKHKQCKYSREQLLRNLEILGTLSAPLPPDLPPSPPPSPRTSHTPTLKRKLDRIDSVDSIKRPRTQALPDARATPRSSQPPLPSSTTSRLARPDRAEPSEDGEVCEETSINATVTATSSTATPRWPPTSRPGSATPFVPVRRPKRGRPPSGFYEEIQEKYHNWGRMLKYSGDARFWSTYPSTHKEYRPLVDPPPPDSPYHKYGELIARLELLDALLCFTYSIWSKDVARKMCFKDTWTTIEAFLHWCKSKWSAVDTTNEREKAFVGLIWMIEGFIKARQFYYSTRQEVEPRLDMMLKQCREEIATAMTVEESESDAGSGLSSLTAKNPQMLPSPASIAPANSANSTPSSRANGTPNVSSNSSGSGATSSSSTATAPPRPPLNTTDLSAFAHPALQIPLALFPTSPSGQPSVPLPGTAAFAAAQKITVPLPPKGLWTLHNLTTAITSSVYSAERSSTTLTLSVLARHFPITFARMVYSNLAANEEYEPDMEDTEGELFWPGSAGGAGGGEGLGWVCLMGKAMIKEFGKEIGYLGPEGVVPKPKPEEGQSSAGTAQGGPPQHPPSSQIPASR